MPRHGNSAALTHTWLIGVFVWQRPDLLRRSPPKRHPNPALVAVLLQVWGGTVELSHPSSDTRIAAAALFHEAEIEQEIRHRLVAGARRTAGKDRLGPLVIRQGARAGDDDPVVEDLYQHPGTKDRVVPMRHRVDHALTDGGERDQPPIRALHAAVTFIATQGFEPGLGVLYLLIEAATRLAGEQDIVPPVRAGVSDQIDPQIARRRVLLRGLTKAQQAEQRRPEVPAEIAIEDLPT